MSMVEISPRDSRGTAGTFRVPSTQRTVRRLRVLTSEAGPAHSFSPGAAVATSATVVSVERPMDPAEIDVRTYVSHLWAEDWDSEDDAIYDTW